MKRLLLVLIGCLIGCLSASAQVGQIAIVTTTAGGGMGTPIYYQHISSSTNPTGNGISGRAFVFHTEPLPANTVAVMAVSVAHGKTVTISDTLVGSWSGAVCTQDAGTGLAKVYLFVQSLGTSAGNDTITIGVGSTNTQPVQFDITFWQNINTSSPTGGSLCPTGGALTPSSGGLISPGSFTPSPNNNANGGYVIWNYTPICTTNASSNASSWTAASGFTLLNAETIWATNNGFPQASQYFVQTSVASVTPSITANGENSSGDCFNSVSVALAVANNGAATLTAIHVAVIGHESFITFSSPGTMTFQWPAHGNLRIIAFTWLGDSPGGNAGVVTAITSSDSCNFTEGAGMRAAGGGSIWYAQNCSPCPTCTVSLTFTGTFTEPQGSFRYYDVINAQASSYQNNVSDGIITCPTTVNDAPTFTPTGASSGLTIQVMGDGTGPVTGFASGSPAGASFDNWTFTGQTDSDLADNADASDHYYYATTATQNWNFTINTAEECTPAAAAFN